MDLWYGDKRGELQAPHSRAPVFLQRCSTGLSPCSAPAPARRDRSLRPSSLARCRTSLGFSAHHSIGNCSYCRRPPALLLKLCSVRTPTLKVIRSDCLLQPRLGHFSLQNPGMLLRRAAVSLVRAMRRPLSTMADSSSSPSQTPVEDLIREKVRAHHLDIYLGCTSKPPQLDNSGAATDQARDLQ